MRDALDVANAAGGPDSDAVDALLIAPDSRISARFASLLLQEGYRVRVVDSVAAAIEAANEFNAVVAFAPASSFIGGPNSRDVFLLREQLRPLSSNGVPVVVLGDGWESRVADANRELRGVPVHRIRTHTADDVPSRPRDGSHQRGTAVETFAGSGPLEGPTPGPQDGDAPSPGPDPGPAPGATPGAQPGPAPGATAAGADVGSGKHWHFFCPGHYTSYRKAMDPTRHPAGEGEGSEQYDHANEYGPSRSIQYLAQQDLAAHIDSWPQHVSIAIVEQE